MRELIVAAVAVTYTLCAVGTYHSVLESNICLPREKQSGPAGAAFVAILWPFAVVGVGTATVVSSDPRAGGLACDAKATLKARSPSTGTGG